MRVESMVKSAKNTLCVLSAKQDWSTLSGFWRPRSCLPEHTPLVIQSQWGHAALFARYAFFLNNIHQLVPIDRCVRKFRKYNLLAQRNSCITNPPCTYLLNRMRGNTLVER